MGRGMVREVVVNLQFLESALYSDPLYSGSKVNLLQKTLEYGV